MNVFGVFDRRVRGFRIIEIGALCIVLVLAMVVYLAKTGAGGQRDDIDRIQDQIDGEQARIGLLRAEVARLERPERLEDLSGRFLNLQPVAPAHEIDLSALPTLAKGPPAALSATAKAAPPGAALAANAAGQPAAASESQAPAAPPLPPGAEDAARAMNEAAAQ
jgi:hypothetical protein